MANAKPEPRQISVRLPEKLYAELRAAGYSLHRSHTRIIIEALTLYLEVAKANRAKGNQTE